MPQNLVSKLVLIVSSPRWNEFIGATLGQGWFEELLEDTLKVGDKRSFVFWLGKINNKTKEREQGFLERHGYLEWSWSWLDPKGNTSQHSQLYPTQNEYPFQCPPISTFKILKGLKPKPNPQTQLQLGGESQNG